MVAFSTLSFCCERVLSMARKRGLSSDQKAEIRRVAAEFTGPLHFDSALEKLMSFLRTRGVIDWNVKPGQVVRIVRGRKNSQRTNEITNGMCHYHRAPRMRDRNHPLPRVAPITVH